jgi:hypothetical protein
MEASRVMSDNLRTILARDHAAWLNEVRTAIGPAQASTAGPWARWQALRYLDQTFPARVARERRLVEALGERLSETDRAQLWALGELLDVLPAYLSHLVGLCHRASEFADVTARVTAALDRWCRALEQAVGRVPTSAVPAGLRDAFGLPASAPAAPTAALV